MNSWDDLFAELKAAHRRLASYWTGVLTTAALLAAPFFIVFGQPWSTGSHVGGWLLLAFSAATVWLFVRISRWAWRVGPAHPYVRFCFMAMLIVSLNEERNRRR